MTITWEQALEECEARLDAASGALERGTPNEVALFCAPDVDGPIPPALLDRARACSVRSDALSAQLADELERIRKELRRLPRMPRAERETRLDVQA